MPRRSVDIVFPSARLAVFVDGCFWHGCPLHATSPANNAAWWRKKLNGNVERDRETSAHLEQLGWSVLRVWEHEDADDVADEVAWLLVGKGRNRRAPTD
jgi:DNA mismatch endonuclease (patch repair protein)